MSLLVVIHQYTASDGVAAGGGRGRRGRGAAVGGGGAVAGGDWGLKIQFQQQIVINQEVKSVSPSCHTHARKFWLLVQIQQRYRTGNHVKSVMLETGKVKVRTGYSIAEGTKTQAHKQPKKKGTMKIQASALTHPYSKQRPGRDADPSPPSNAVGHKRVELYLYSPYGPYGLYRASVSVQGCTLLFPLPYLLYIFTDLSFHWPHTFL